MTSTPNGNMDCTSIRTSRSAGVETARIFVLAFETCSALCRLSRMRPTLDRCRMCQEAVEVLQGNGRVDFEVGERSGCQDALQGILHHGVAAADDGDPSIPGDSNVDHLEGVDKLGGGGTSQWLTTSTSKWLGAGKCHGKQLARMGRARESGGECQDRPGRG